MLSDSEREVIVGAAMDVETLRLVEDLLVVVRRGVPERDLLALPDLLATDLGILVRRAPEVVHGRGVAQDLLDGRGDQRRVLNHLLQCIRVLDQKTHALRGHRTRSLVSSGQEQHEERAVLELVQLLAVDLGMQQLGGEILLRAPLVALTELVRVAEDLGRRHACVCFGGLEFGIVEADQLVGELEEQMTVLLGNTHELTDHLQR